MQLLPLLSQWVYLLWFVPPSSFRLLSSDDGIAKYMFNNHVIEHYFCARCGCAPFGLGTLRSGTKAALINVRCLSDVDCSSVERIPVDGRSS